MNRYTLLCLVSLLAVMSACNTDPKSASRRYVGNGNKYLEKGRPKQASIMYRRALQKDPRNGDAWHGLGQSNAAEGAYREALRDFQRAADLDGPHKLDATAKAGDLDFVFYSANPQVKEFLTELKTMSDNLLKADKKSYDGLRLAGYYAFARMQKEDKEPAEKKKDLDEATQKFKEANDSKPYQPEVVTMLVQTLLATNQPAEAENLAKQQIDKTKNYTQIYNVLYTYYLRSNRPQDAEQLLKKKIENNPGRGDFLSELAFHYLITQHRPEMLATLSQLTSDKKKYPNGRLLVGDFYYATRDFDHAIEQYREGVKEDPKQKIVYQKKLAEALTVRGKSDEAAKVVADLIKENPADPEAIAMHASLMLKGADRRQADAIIAQLQPLVSKTPTNQLDRLAILHFNLARAYALKGDAQSLDQARLHFQETLKARPNYIPAKLALAQLELNRGESPQALQHAAEILAIDRGNVTARLIRTWAFMSMQEYDQCRQELSEIIKSNPTSNDARFQMGKLNFLQKHYKEAEFDFDLLAKANDPRGFAGLVECKVAQGQHAEALRMIEGEVGKHPDNIMYREALASLQFSQKKYADAAKQLQTIIDNNPKSPDLPAYYMRLGEARRMAGDFNGSVVSFNKARELSPKDPIPLLQLALLYENNGKPDEARKAYEEVLKMQPDNPVALNNVAYTKADEGVDLDQALTLAERARSKRPDDPNVIDTVGLIFVKKNLTDDGLRLLRELVARVPANPTYHLHLAMALYQKGDKSEAKKELQTAQRYGPTDKEQQRIRELMAKIG
jgi:tetratricopeptide (TPR) repeat protein